MVGIDELENGGKQSERSIRNFQKSTRVHLINGKFIHAHLLTDNLPNILICNCFTFPYISFANNFLN